MDSRLAEIASEMLDPRSRRLLLDYEPAPAPVRLRERVRDVLEAVLHARIPIGWLARVRLPDTDLFPLLPPPSLGAIFYGFLVGGWSGLLLVLTGCAVFAATLMLIARRR